MKIGIGITPTSTSFIQILKRERKRKRPATPNPSPYRYTTFNGASESGRIWYDNNIGIGVGNPMFSGEDLIRPARGGTYSDGVTIISVDRNGIITDYR
jgi:hypothetical protein